MSNKLYMKKQIVLLGCLAILIVACAGCITPEISATNTTNGSTIDPIVGTWQSTQSYTVDGEELYIIYVLNADNTGTAMLAKAGSTSAEELDVYWGNSDGTYVFAYSTDTSTVYPHTLSADAKTLTDQYGDTYTRI